MKVNELEQQDKLNISDSVAGTMTLQDALKVLGIEEYAQRILNSSSRGELFHIEQYFTLAKAFKSINVTESNVKDFAKWFRYIVEWAEENWDRPESIFQHITRVLIEHGSSENE